MKKAITGVCYVFICCIVGIAFSHVTTLRANSDHYFTIQSSGHTDICLSCHMVGDLHAEEEHSDCSQCHDGSAQAGNVGAGACISCHPTDDPGKCNLADHHGSSCTQCHTECGNATSTTTTVLPSGHTDICLACHMVGDMHAEKEHSDCSQCHDGSAQAGNVGAGACISCHPTDDPGKCNLADQHNSSCLKCHTECSDDTSTTTTTGPTTTVEPTSTHIDICTECHFINDLHEREEHDSCSQCHDGTPKTGNVEPGVCADCHPTDEPNKCGLTNEHGESCLTCHFECSGDSTPTTTIEASTTTTEPAASTHITICTECHYPSDLHERSEHTGCNQCHDGTPEAGNVEPGSCSACHPMGDPGKCSLVNDHGVSCTECHFECSGEATTSTTTTKDDTSTTTIATDFCPSELLFQGNTEKLTILRAFRDDVLHATPQGKAYIDLYYHYANEISFIMLLNPDLQSETLYVLDKMLPEIKTILKGQKDSFSVEVESEIALLLEKVAYKVSPELRQEITMAKKNLSKLLQQIFLTR